MEQISESKIKLCACGKRGCPIITDDGEDVIIEDDYGNSIKIKKEEAKLIQQAIGYFE